VAKSPPDTFAGKATLFPNKSGNSSLNGTKMKKEVGHGVSKGTLCFSAILVAVAFISAVLGFVVLAGKAAFVLRLCFVGSMLLFALSMALRKETR